MGGETETYMVKKQRHGVTTWKIPRRPAKQEKPLTFEQQAISWRLCSWDTTLATAAEPDVVPSRTKYGEIPKELLRVMMR